MTRFTDQKIPCVNSCLSNNMKNWGAGQYNSLRHTDDRKYFSSLSLTQSGREVHTILLVSKMGGICRCSCWEKGNFTLIYEFKYCQTWKSDHLLLVPLKNSKTEFSLNWSTKKQK